MDVVYRRCAGLDVHKKSVSVCVLISSPQAGAPSRQIRSFGTMLEDLERLRAWLIEEQVSHVAMESTGVYWQPVWNVLEGYFQLLLVNAGHVKAVPGRKTDARDCEWLAELLRHGLLRASFVPDQAQRELRELTRYRTSLLQERTGEVNRLHKTLEGANIKLASVATDLLGASGRQMLEQLVAGGSDPSVLAELARGKLREKLSELERSLSGRFGPHHRFMVAQQLAHIDYLDELIERLDGEIAERMRPFDELIEHLDAVPGLGRRTAEVLIAEVGADMSRFATDGHLASWAGMCPGNNISAGKHLSGKTRKGNRHVRAALSEAAQAAMHKKGSYLAAQGRRLASRIGRKKAVFAVAHSILVIVYHMIKQPDSIYRDLGMHYFDQRDRDRIERGLVRRLEGLGYRVSLQPAAA